VDRGANLCRDGGISIRPVGGVGIRIGGGPLLGRPGQGLADTRLAAVAAASASACSARERAAVRAAALAARSSSSHLRLASSAAATEGWAEPVMVAAGAGDARARGFRVSGAYGNTLGQRKKAGKVFRSLDTMKVDVANS